jgi:hypothetical protein
MIKLLHLNKLLYILTKHFISQQNIYLFLAKALLFDKTFLFSNEPFLYGKTFVLIPLPTQLPIYLPTFPPSFCFAFRDVCIAIKIYGSYHYDYLKFYVFIFLG